MTSETIKHWKIGDVEIANRVLHRLGFGPATTAVVTTAVRHHLLLTETATRRPSLWASWRRSSRATCHSAAP